MIKLVKIDVKNFKYSIYNGNKCVAEFIVEDKVLLSPEVVEELRIANYVVA